MVPRQGRRRGGGSKKREGREGGKLPASWVCLRELSSVRRKSRRRRRRKGRVNFDVVILILSGLRLWSEVNL